MAGVGVCSSSVCAALTGGLNAEPCFVHCSMARSKSESHRRRINSNTVRFRCGKSCANMSMAFCETGVSFLVFSLSMSKTGIGELEVLGEGGAERGSVTVMP